MTDRIAPAPTTRGLTGRTVLVAGGSGQVGEGIVDRLLAAGAGVIVPTRSDLDSVARRHGDAPGLVVLPGALGSAAEARDLRTQISDAGIPITDVVASIGGWWQGPAVGALPPEEWDHVIRMGLDAHFHTANTFLPVLSALAGASYTFVNGGGALGPVPGSGVVSVSAAAQLMLARVVAAEQAGGPVSVSSLVAGTPVRTRDRPTGPAGWLTAADLGRAVVGLVHDGLHRPHRHPPVIELAGPPDVDRLLTDTAGRGDSE